MEMNMLSIDDIKAMKIGPNMSHVEILTEVIEVATKKLERERVMREREKEKDGINNVNKLEIFINRLRLMIEKILEQVVVEDKVRSSQKNRPRRNNCFKWKHSLEEEAMEFKKEKNMPISPKRKVCFESEAASDEDVPELPAEFKNYITAIGGSDVKLVIQKQLYAADVKPDQSRLSIPISQIKDNFLTDAEKTMLYSRKDEDKKHYKEIEVRLIDPSLNEQIICLRKWEMKKSAGNYSSIYVLAKSWNEVVLSNRLKSNNLVQLWSFRVATQLCFALVKVTRGREDCGSSSHSTSSSRRSEEDESSSPENEIEDGGMIM